MKQIFDHSMNRKYKVITFLAHYLPKKALTIINLAIGSLYAFFLFLASLLVKIFLSGIVWIG
ncbi:MAG: hypothetical protein ACX93T_00725 [Bacteroidota bacterium]